MPLDDPANEEIAKRIFERLTDSGDFTVVRQTKQLDEWTPEDRQVVMVAMMPERAEDIDHPGNPPANGYQMEVRFRLHVMQSEHDETPTEDLLSRLAADVMVACTDAPNWHQWDEIAINSEFGSLESVPNDGGIDAAMLPLVVSYRITEGNPYEVRA
jgi:hypothetical protein